MEPIPDLVTLSDDELDSMIRGLEDEEEQISLRRRVLHGQIDLLRSERNARLRDQVSSGEEDATDPGLVAATVVRDDEVGSAEDASVPEEVEALPDLAALSSDELRALIRELDHEEDEISLRRRVLHGRIDILRAERQLRARDQAEPSHVDVDRLKEILATRLVSRPGDEST